MNHCNCNVTGSGVSQSTGATLPPAAAVVSLPAVSAVVASGASVVAAPAVVADASVLGASLPAGTPAWGAGWKKAMKDWYGHSMKVSISTTCMSYRGNYLDLDPTYKDPYGQPLLRITFDWKENELKLQRFLLQAWVERQLLVPAVPGPRPSVIKEYDCQRFD